MDFAVCLLAILAVVWLLGRGGVQFRGNSPRSADPSEGRDAAARQLTLLGRDLFERSPQVSHLAFAEKMGDACRTAGVSTVAAFYGMRAMAFRGGITRERVALLLA